jgi:hypothetical protein
LVAPSLTVKLHALAENRTMFKHYVGIDSDSKGSVAVFSVDEAQKKFKLAVFPFKTRIWLKEDGGKSTLIDEDHFIDLMTQIVKYCGVNLKKLTIEEQWGRPGNNSVAAFTFAQNYGAILSGCRSALLTNKLTHIPNTLTHSKTWKSALGLDADKDKNVAMATRLFPKCAKGWKLDKHTSSAEAALICFHAMGLDKVRFTMGSIVEANNDAIYSHAKSTCL